MYNVKVIEYCTEALVLDKEVVGEEDARVFLFTRDLGLIAALAKSVKKITSKLNSHLEPLSLVSVRLVNKNSWRVADALRIGRLSDGQLGALRLIKYLSPEVQPDSGVWNLISRGELSENGILIAAGFDPKFASCQSCGGVNNLSFSLKNLEYFCQNCFNEE